MFERTEVNPQTSIVMGWALPTVRLNTLGAIFEVLTAFELILTVEGY